jgi:hypothetical protein
MSRARRRAVALGLAAATVAASVTTQPGGPAALTPIENRRAPEQTFLTYPEWFLVFSPAEYAEFVRASPPSEFPFFGHLRQFWQAYRAVARAAEPYPANWGYHVMIVVIGVSTTVEYGLRAAYETLIGRLTELAAGGARSAEDAYGARVAQEYVDFIRVRPWYEFDFLRALRGLWADTPLFGRHLLRKWERRYALTSEYLAKALYGWLIGRATRSAYAAESTVTAVVVDALPAGVQAELPALRVLTREADGRALLHVPRYQAFQDHALALARHGARFEEIAGNRGEILVSALVPRGFRPSPGAKRLLFAQPLLTQPQTERLVLTVPVPELHAALVELATPPRRLEHVYDY